MAAASDFPIRRTSPTSPGGSRLRQLVAEADRTRDEATEALALLFVEHAHVLATTPAGDMTSGVWWLVQREEGRTSYQTEAGKGGSLLPRRIDLDDLIREARVAVDRLEDWVGALETIESGEGSPLDRPDEQPRDRGS